MKPLIGVTADIDDGSRFNEKLKGKRIVHLWERYLLAVRDAGAAAVLLPPSANQADAGVLLDRIDGLLVSGGAFDVPPSYYGEHPIKAAGVKPKLERSQFERELILLAARRGLPVLGICGGVQIINVTFGGSLYQDLSRQRKGHLAHEQKLPPSKVSHEVAVSPDTLLARLVFGRQIRRPVEIMVNSTHHQAVKTVGRGLRVCASAPDGIIEAIESETGFILGVQWHPELLYPHYPEQARLLKKFVEEAKR
jgi:putative glutamine amidotransferase